MFPLRTFSASLVLLLALAAEIPAASPTPGPVLPVVPVRISRIVAGFPWAFDAGSRPPSVLGLEGSVLDSSTHLTLREDIVLPGVIWRDSSVVVVGLHWLWSNDPDARIDLGALPPDAAPIPYASVGMDERIGLMVAEPADATLRLPPASLRLPAVTQTLPEDKRLVCTAGGPSFRLIPVSPGAGRTLVPPPGADVPPLLSPVFTVQGRFDGFCLPFTPAGGPAGSWEWIPAEEVSKRIQFVAANHANVSSGYLGVFFGVEDLDMPETTVYLRGIVPGSPAETGGLAAGDILARIDGRPVRSPRQAVQLLRNLGPNDKVKVDLVRDGQVQRRTVTLGKRMPDPAPVDEIVRFQLPRIREVALERLRVNPMPAVPTGLDANPTMGIFLRNASAPLREAMGWKGSECALVALVLPGFPAALAGLQAGDLLLDIDGRPVTQVSDVSSLLRSRQKGQTVPIRYFRQGRVHATSVTLR